MARVAVDPSAHTFRDQSIGEHVLIVVVGALLGFVSYVYLAGFLGGAGAVAATGAAAARRTAIALSGLLVGAYLARASLNGIGGPLLNLGYLLVHLVATPVVAAWMAGRALPSDLVFAGVLLAPGTLLDVLLVLVLPVSAYALGQALWFRHRCSAHERIAWADDHLPAGYRGTPFDPSRFDRGRSESN